MAASKETRSVPANSEEMASQKDNNSLDDEINGLVGGFKGQCKVLESTGRFKKTIKLNPEGQNIVFNFQIPDGYPTIPAVIEIRCEALGEDERFDLKHFLTQVMEKESTTSFQRLVDTGLEWLKEGNINVNGAKKKIKPSSPNKNGKGRRKKESVDKPKKQKKPPMKTAIDVIKRILWDADMDRDHCIVGYMDRLEGLKEKYFNAFSWEDIASVDYTVLAIPKHRIQYFKYRGEIVWDKRVRLDNVFGSTGSKITIKDVIRKLDGGESMVNNSADGGADIDEHEAERADSDYYDSDDITDSESDSDDGITVTIGCNAAQGFSGADYEYDDSENVNIDNEDANDGGDGFDKFWRDKLRPNYFIALRITDEDIRRTVKGVQTHINEHEPSFKQCNIPTNALHITLCTLGLDTPEQVQNAVQCLQNAKSELASFVPKDKKLEFSGADHFFNRVVYGKVVDCPTEFYELVEHLKLCLNTQGVEVRDYHEFVPHMTLMKISRPVARATGKKYVPPWLYSRFNDTKFGFQAVDNLHLCEMGDDRQEDGFYITALSMNI